mmetsp:Transcript_32105/g.72796  ORF Transcript_32105/g.72796 Transcript_32105/m.72796 type:complete len:91 (+) Transcript_32105:258-530(+)
MADAAFKPTRYGANVTESALRWHVSTHRITSSSYSDIVFPTSPTRLLWVMTPSMQREAFESQRTFRVGGNHLVVLSSNKSVRQPSRRGRW